MRFYVYTHKKLGLEYINVVKFCAEVRIYDVYSSNKLHNE